MDKQKFKSNQRLEEIRALEGLRQARLKKYHDALKKKQYSKERDVNTLDNDRKAVDRFMKSPTKRRSISIDPVTIGSVDPRIKGEFEKLVRTKSQSEVKAAKAKLKKNQKVKEANELRAKSQLAKLLDKDGEQSIEILGFAAIRNRYLAALEACKPTTIDVSHLSKEAAWKKRHENRQEQAKKKDHYSSISRAWDKYEAAALDKPQFWEEDDAHETEKVEKKEEEVVKAWVSYAKNAVKEAADDEDDEDDMEYWIAEVKRLRSEAESRRLAKVEALETRAQSDEDDFWLQEALRLRAAHKKAKKGDTTNARKKYEDDSDNAPVEGKEFKKGRVYESDSNSDEDDQGGATRQREMREFARKQFAGEDHSEVDVQPTKQFKKGRVYGSDSDSDSDDEGGATYQRQKKVFSDTDEDWNLGTKPSRKIQLYPTDSDNDSDPGEPQKPGNRRKKNYGTDSDDGDISRKASRKDLKYLTSDSDSDSDGISLEVSGGVIRSKKTFVDDDSNGEMERNRSKKSYLDDSSDDSSDDENGVSPAEKKTCSEKAKKLFGHSDCSENGFGTKNHKKKSFLDDSSDDSSSTNEEKAGAKYSKKKKSYGDADDSDDGLRAKKHKKKSFLDDSSDDSPDSDRKTQPNTKKSVSKKKKLNAGSEKKNRNLTANDAVDDASATDDKAQSSVKKTSSVRAKKKKKHEGKKSSDSEVGPVRTKKHKKKSFLEYSSDDQASEDDFDRAAPTKSKKSKKKKSYGSDSSGEGQFRKKTSKKKSYEDDSDSSGNGSDQDLDAERKQVKGEETLKTHHTRDKKDEKSSSKGQFRKKASKKKSYEDDSDSSGNGSDQDLDAERKQVKGEETSKKHHTGDKKDEKSSSKKKKKKRGFVPVNSFDEGNSDDSIRLGDSTDPDDDVNQKSASYLKFFKSEEFEMPSDTDESDTELGKSLKALEVPEIVPPGSALVEEDEWKNTLKGWTNTPQKKPQYKGTKIIMRAPDRTEFWRKTFHRGAQDNGPFHWQKATGDFQATVKVSGGFEGSYQKGGIMVRLDEENWVLTGLEYFNSKLFHSTSHTVGHTDWSLSPLKAGAEKDGTWICYRRRGKTYDCYYSYDGTDWIHTRHGIFVDDQVLYVGIACASSSNGEFRVTFDKYQCKEDGDT